MGADHPYVAIGCRELANLYRDQGRFDEEEDLYERSHQIFEKNPEENGPQAVETMENYILLLHKMNREGEALRLEGRLKTLR